MGLHYAYIYDSNVGCINKNNVPRHNKQDCLLRLKIYVDVYKGDKIMQLLSHVTC